MHQVNQVFLYGTDADDGVDQNGEKDHQRAGQDLGESAVTEPDDQQRGQGNDGYGLESHDVGR
jgi:hypothetical protein